MPVSQLRDLARMRAMVVLPTPRVPVNRKAWCSRSWSRALMRARSTCSWPTISAKLRGRHFSPGPDRTWGSMASQGARRRLRGTLTDPLCGLYRAYAAQDAPRAERRRVRTCTGHAEFAKSRDGVFKRHGLGGRPRRPDPARGEASATVAPFRAWRGSRDLVAQSPKLHSPAAALQNKKRRCCERKV